MDDNVVKFPKSFHDRDYLRFRAQAKIKHTVPWQIQTYGGVLYTPHVPLAEHQFKNVVTRVDFVNKKRVD